MVGVSCSISSRQRGSRLVSFFLCEVQRYEKQRSNGLQCIDDGLNKPSRNGAIAGTSWRLGADMMRVMDGAWKVVPYISIGTTEPLVK